jgi:hypothetical protein
VIHLMDIAAALCRNTLRERIVRCRYLAIFDLAVFSSEAL